MEGLQDIKAATMNANAISVRGLRVVAKRGAQEKALLTDINLDIPEGSFVAIIGPSGCGKSTLLRSLAGIQAVNQGEIELAGSPVQLLRQQFPLAVGYLGQFGAFHADLTVRENLESAAALRLPKSVPVKTRSEWLLHVIKLAGVQDILDQPYRTLSGGQMRRVALAEELIGDPAFLLLDEMTSGLDEHSDLELMQWLRNLAHQSQKTVLLVTHATYHLDLCDSIIFLHSGRLVQHDTLQGLLHAHGVSSTGELLGLYKEGRQDATPLLFPKRTAVLPQLRRDPMPLRTAKPPNGLWQFPEIFTRQCKLFIRDKGQLWMQLALILIFPALVAVFATAGLPQVRNLTLSLETNILHTMQEQLLYLQESFKAASLISGLAMFQVVLLTLMGANNSAREIAKERPVLDKELRTGLSPAAYVLSKFQQITLLCALQSFWMTWFVKTLCGFPGSFLSQFAILFATTLAMSAICLAISAASSSPERGSLLSIYLVGFQMPLSGAALSLPAWLSGACQPFIAAYWGWSGYLMTFQSTRHYDIVKQSTKTEIASYPLSLGVLLLQITIGLGAAIYFVGRKRSCHSV